MGIIRNVDVILNPGNGTVNAEDIVWQVPVTPNCGQLCEEIIQEEIICNQSDAWNNNLCPNDFCYSAPVVPGDCLHFQFQFQNTRNAKTTISYLQFLQRPNPKIRYNWYHPTINPTDWTIRARMFNACTNAEYKDPVNNYNYADIFMRQDREQVEGVQVFDKAINRSVRLVFCNKGSEEPIPNDQGPGIISV